MDRPPILCVDDEPNLLNSLKLHLRRHFDVSVAPSGPKGLELVRQRGPFAVVLSDMRMPEMDGAAFLAHVRDAAPSTVRMLLTGCMDFSCAVAVVNEVQIFRLLTKPCPPKQLRIALDAAIDQHRLLSSERELLEHTLCGSIQRLADVLAIANPKTFGRLVPIRRYAAGLALELSLPNRWQVEVAAMLSQLCHATLPAETAEKIFLGQDLNDQEIAVLTRLPLVARRVLGDIPRLEGVVALLVGQQAQAEEGSDHEREVRLDVQVLRAAADFATLEARGYAPEVALATMRNKQYAPEILKVFAEVREAMYRGWTRQQLPLRALRQGMIFAEDVFTTIGEPFVAGGYEVSPCFLEKLRHLPAGLVREPVSVFVDGRAEQSMPQSQCGEN